MCPGVRQDGWLRWSAHPFGGVECWGHAQYFAFAPSSSEVAVVVFFCFLFWSFCILIVVQNLPELSMHPVIFSSL